MAADVRRLLKTVTHTTISSFWVIFTMMIDSFSVFGCIPVYRQAKKKGFIVWLTAPTKLAVAVQDL